MEAGSEAKTVIGEDVEIVGAVKCAGNIEIKGKLEGDLACGGKAVIGASAVIKGNLTVDSSSIFGQINGNISAKDRIEMKSSARVHGDIKSKRLTVEDGVTFIGKSEVNPSGTPPERAAGGRGGDTGADSSAKEDDKGKNSAIFGRK